MADSESMASPLVVVVDDDPEMRESLVWMLEKDKLAVEAYASVEEVLAGYDSTRPGCLVLDLRLGPTTGLKLIDSLRKIGCQHPFVVISGHGDVESAVQSMRRGAIDFIEKPFDRKHFLSRVHQAIERDAADRVQRSRWAAVEKLLDSLTKREREVMELVVAGRLTKQIARQLGISDKTVEVHRSNFTKKMGVASVAELVRIVTEYRTSDRNSNATDDAEQ